MRLAGAMSQFHSNPLVVGADRKLSGQIKVDDSQLSASPSSPVQLNWGGLLGGKARAPWGRYLGYLGWNLPA
ncbi:hypothetical protein FA13DRAFT_1735642 [Coprinellus micaceus]|uniref:Uncharacterized protein n=1 Tax=Coprinellus micaceus TaxID=71717 RepID=A0A4Y7T2X3_COPMI|nr:hypothetical protein FA13DRAFT_1735642 [Coprinellus micaceus]